VTWAPSSALEPAGPQAARLAQVYWSYFYVCAVVYAAVMSALALAIVRRARAGPAFDPRRRIHIVAAAGGLTALVLLALLGITVHAGHGLNPPIDAHGVTTVRVIARQWWWEFRYPDPSGAPDQEVVTANELHIPAGTPVLLELTSRDVIHSFWVPALHGKRDLIPGHDSTTYIQADQPGVFRGQCAEFCGTQHARMGLLVIAETAADHQSWLTQQRQIPAPPVTAAAVHGRELFLHGTCPMCHTILGTPAAAVMGPDLTHVADRRTLGAGTLDNRRQQLAAWIRDAHGVKPGVRMPPTSLEGDDVNDLSAYLEGLR
jgi:cytochrome c oxidase subunit 2